MKKIVSLVLCFSLTLGIFIMPTVAENRTQVKINELVFTSTDGTPIGEITNGPVKLKATVSANGAENINIYVASYTSDGSLISVDAKNKIFSGASTEVIQTSLGADSTNAARVSAFVLNSDLTPVGGQRVDLGSQAILFGASITIPNYRNPVGTTGTSRTFNAIVNNDNKTVTFYIPYTTYVNEINADDGTAVPGVKPDVDGVTYSFDKIGTTPNYTNANEFKTLRVTSPDSSSYTDYTVEHKFVAVERRLVDESAATIDSGNNNIKYTNGDSILQDNFMPDSGYMQLTNGGTTKGEDSIQLNYDLTGKSQDIIFRSPVYGKSYGNDHVKISYKFKVNDFSPASDNVFAYGRFLNATTDFLYKSVTNDTFEIYHRMKDGESQTRFEYCPQLKKNTWYTITMVVDKDKKYENGYIINAYIDGKYIGSAADYIKDVPLASFDRNAGYDLQIASYSTSTFDMDIADIEILSVMSDNTNGKTSVHILGDSIAKFYDTETSKDTSIEGWGYALSQNFDLAKTRVLNHSVGGYNTNIYLNGTDRNGVQSEPVWPTIKSDLKEGDYVLIALGRNEYNTTDGTKDDTVFKANLKKLADDIVAAKAIPVFVTAIPKVDISETGVYSLNNDIYTSPGFAPAKSVQEFATDNEYTLLDLNTACNNAFSEKTSEELEAIFMKDKETEGIHVNETGAVLLANQLISLINAGESGLKSLLK